MRSRASTSGSPSWVSETTRANSSDSGGWRLLAHHLDRPEERVAGRQRRGDEREGVGELRLELLLAPADADRRGTPGPANGARAAPIEADDPPAGDRGEQAPRPRRRTTPTITTNSPGRTGTLAFSSDAPQRSLLVELGDHLAGEAGQVLDEGALLGDRGEVDVLLAVGQVEDVGEPLLAVVDPGEEPDDQGGEAEADADHGDDLGGVHRRYRSLLASGQLGDFRHTDVPRRPRVGAVARTGGRRGLERVGRHVDLALDELVEELGTEAGGDELAGGLARARCPGGTGT